MVVIIEEAKSISVRKFGTLNTATEETKLPIGDSPNMSNIWTDEAPGSVQTAKGYILAGTAPSGNPIKFLFNFKQDDGTQLALVSDNATVWTTRDFSTFTSIITGLSSSFQLRATVARGKTWLTNGNDSVRTYNGSSVTVLDGTGATPNVPKGKYITYYHERVWVYNISGERSSCRFTALTDSGGTEIAPDNASAWPAINEIKIGDGDGDFGTGMPLYDQKLHFGKTRSIWRLEGIDEFSYFPFKTRAEIGPRVIENVQVLDGFLHFVSLGGIYTFNGDTTERISDILNPTSGLGNLSVGDIQQPDTNQQFWLQDSATDFDAGTKSSNIDTSSGRLVLKPCDTSSADFAAGVDKTNIDTSGDEIKLSRVSTSTPSDTTTNEVEGSSGSVSGSGFSTAIIVSDMANAFDSSDSTFAEVNGRISSQGSGSISIEVVLPSTKTINRIALSNYSSWDPANGALSLTIQYWTGSTWSTLGTVSGSTGLADAAVTFSPLSISQIRLVQQTSSYGGLLFNPPITWQRFRIGTLTANLPGFVSSGKFVSKTLDLKAVPTSLGKFQVDYDLNSGTVSFFTQTSSDGASWGAETAATPGLAIASTPLQYFRWGINLAPITSQVSSPIIRKVYGPGLFNSQTHDTTSTIYQWKAYQTDQDSSEGTILHFYRTATTTGGLSAKSWTAIVPGGDIISATSDDCIQFKIEMSAGTYTREPSIDAVTINWIVGTAGEVRSEQLVHGISWNGRYWIDCSELGETANNIVIIRGRKAFDYPWQLKRDWPMLALFIFNDNLYGGSSADSKIYRLDSGYSANGSALDSYFETGDMTGDEAAFQKNLLQIIADYELMGANADYTLSIGVSIDRGLTWTEKLVSLLGTGRTTKAVNLFKNERQFRFRFRTNGVDQPFIAHGLDALYRPTKFR